MKNALAAEWIGAWGLTEPNTGSDAGNMRTVAVEDGDYYVLNGAKNFITHGKSGNIAVVIARTEPPERDTPTVTEIKQLYLDAIAAASRDALAAR